MSTSFLSASLRTISDTGNEDRLYACPSSVRSTMHREGFCGLHLALLETARYRIRQSCRRSSLAWGLHLHTFEQ